MSNFSAVIKTTLSKNFLILAAALLGPAACLLGNSLELPSAEVSLPADPQDRLRYLKKQDREAGDVKESLFLREPVAVEAELTLLKQTADGRYLTQIRYLAKALDGSARESAAAGREEHQMLLDLRPISPQKIQINYERKDPSRYIIVSEVGFVSIAPKGV